MPAPRFGYQLEKFSAARTALMAPHRPPDGEARAFAYALGECMQGLHDLRVEAVADDSARDWIHAIVETMDTTGISDPAGRGTFLVKAEQLGFEEKLRFSEAVDGLASYFVREFWSS